MSKLKTKVAATTIGLVLGSSALMSNLHRLEKQELTVYADKLAKNLPTYCSGRTMPTQPVGKTFTKEECDAIDKATAIEYGSAILACIPADKMTQNNFDAMTLFAINIGKKGACDSRAAQLFRADKKEEACNAIAFGPQGQKVWATANGIYIRGLHNRRLFERDLCSK